MVSARVSSSHLATASVVVVLPVSSVLAFLMALSAVVRRPDRIARIIIVLFRLSYRDVIIIALGCCYRR